MRTNTNLLLLCLIICILSGCSDDSYFSPYDPLEKNLVLYAVLDNRLEDCLVKVQQIYIDPEKKKPEGKLTAILKPESGGEYFLKDTLINDGNRFVYFKIPTKILKRGVNYKIVVMKEGFNTRWAECRFQVKPDFKIDCYRGTYKNKTQWIADFCFSRNGTKAFLSRILIDYEISDGGAIEQRKFDVPMGAYISPYHPKYIPSKFIYEYNFEDLDVVYPIAQDINKEDPVSLIIRYEDYIYRFEEDGFAVALKYIGKNMPAKNVKIKGFFAILYSIDENYFYQTINKQNERWSIRLDQEFYWTNITGYDKYSTGFFGSFTADTVKFTAMAELINIFGYVDAQKY